MTSNNTISENTNKSFKIFIYGIISQAVALIMGMMLPKLLIVNYGSEVNGMLSSLRQIFVYVSLLEAGIGTASLQAMYAPVANNDYDKTSQIMAATHYYYRRTGVLYGLAVVILAIVYPLTVKSDIAFSVIAGVVLLQGASGVINYFFQGKYTILLRVDGKKYISTNVVTIANIISKIAQILLILLGANVLVVQAAYFLINLLQMIYISWYVKKNYAWLDLKSTPDFMALKQSKNVIVHQISGLVFNNTDILLLTYFCGLKTVSIYALYSMVVSCVSNVIDTLSISVEFVLGQSFNSDREKFVRLQETYETYYLAISFAFFTVTALMLPSFIMLYSRGMTDAVYVDKYLPYLFVILNVLMYSRRTSMQIINFAGHFKQTQSRSICESIINLSVSLVLVYKIGIYGVLIGTIVALLYRTNDVIIYANWKILGRKPWRTYRRWFQNIIVMIICFICIKFSMPTINSYLMWGLNSIWVTLVCFIVFLSIDSLFDKKSFKYVLGLKSR